jgi:hypothetical protein
VTVTVPGYEFKPEEIAQLDRAPRELTIKLTEPFIRVSFDNSGTRVLAPDTVAGHGVARQTKEYLDANCRRASYVLVKSFAHGTAIVAIAATAVGCAVAFAAGALGAPLAVPRVLGIAGGFLTVLAYVLFVGIDGPPRRSLISIARRSTHESLWKRYGDRIIPSVVSSVVSGVLMLLVGLAVGRGSSKVETTGQPVVAPPTGAAGDAGPEAGIVTPP